MNKKQAIVILEYHLNGSHDGWYRGTAEAIKLGIEALRRLEEYRSRKIVSEFNRLPGETEEVE